MDGARDGAIWVGGVALITHPCLHALSPLHVGGGGVVLGGVELVGRREDPNKDGWGFGRGEDGWPWGKGAFVAGLGQGYIGGCPCPRCVCKALGHHNRAKGVPHPKQGNGVVGAPCIVMAMPWPKLVPSTQAHPWLTTPKMIGSQRMWSMLALISLSWACLQVGGRGGGARRRGLGVWKARAKAWPKACPKWWWEKLDPTLLLACHPFPHSSHPQASDIGLEYTYMGGPSKRQGA
jgi:hypothetical protein